MQEHILEQQLRTAVEAADGICWKLVSPGTAGVPDRICLRHGRTVFVELKAPGQKPRPLQQHRLQQLRQQGFVALVVDSADGIEEVLDALHAA